MLTTIQIMTLIFSILSIIIIYYWRKKEKKIVLYSVPVILWLLHITIFYTMYILDFTEIIHVHIFNNFLFTLWSPYLRFHGVFTVFYFALIESEIILDIFKGGKRIWKQLMSLKKF